MTAAWSPAALLKGKSAFPLASIQTFSWGSRRLASWIKLGCLPPSLPRSGSLAGGGPWSKALRILLSCHIQFTTQPRWHLGAVWMGAHSKPQTERAANDWVLMMPAISAHRKVAGACSPGAHGRKQSAHSRTFGAASKSVVCMTHRSQSEQLPLGLSRETGAGGK